MYNYEEYNAPKSISLKTWSKMLPFMKPYAKKIAAVAALMALAALIDIMLPLLLRIAVNNYIVPNKIDDVVQFAVFAVLICIVQGGVTIVFTRLAMRIELNVSRSLRRASFFRLQTLSFSYYNVTPVGYMLARVMGDTTRIGEMIAWGLVDIMWSVVYIIGVSISMFILNWQLALLILAVLPPISLITYWFQTRILRLNREVRRINSHMTGLMNEGITGTRTSKTLVIEDLNTREFGKVTGNMYSKSVKMALYSSIFNPIVMFFGSLATVLVLTRGGALVIGDVILIGTLAAFVNYAVGVFEPIQNVARILSDFVSTQANIERVTGLIESQPDIVDKPEVIEKYGDSFNPKRENWEPIKGDIEFRDVTFRYPDGGENILEHFNLTIPAGTYVAIVGETGAGKSTLVNLACRFFEPTEGSVLIDGRDYRERSQLWLHSNIGYVLQDPHLFSGSILENIRYGRLDATDEEVYAAAKAVSADKIINKLPNGMATDVGEGGDLLSTGEKQLISFARAVLADPAIFVLDEATSSVDTETEQLIQSAITHMLKNRTSFVIAHRLSTIRSADIILVVKDGKIIERGTHSELIRARGHYYDLYTRQFEEESEKKVLEGTL